jgi:hypothetical protein
MFVSMRRVLAERLPVSGENSYENIRDPHNTPRGDKAAHYFLKDSTETARSLRFSGLQGQGEQLLVLKEHRT